MTSDADDRRILCVGLACLDFVTLVTQFPIEDTDSRSAVQYWQRGGNASNNCTILSHLGASCELLTSLPAETPNLGSFASSFLVDDFKKHNIINENCDVYENHDCPCSVVIINRSNGSRTILHQKGTLPDVTLQNFKKLQLANYKWIHFESRNPRDMAEMMQIVRDWNLAQTSTHKITISMEVEKPHSEPDLMAGFADFLFISKDFAMAKRFNSKEDAVKMCYAKLIKEGCTVICPWGEQGVSARVTPSDQVVSAPAYPPPKVLDTLGAGDTFIAGTIYALSEGWDLKCALSFSSHLAGHKCGLQGYSGLKKDAPEIYEKHFSQHSQTC